MKLSPPASSSDLDAAREIARRLHQRRRREDRPGLEERDDAPSLFPPASRAAMGPLELPRPAPGPFEPPAPRRPQPPAPPEPEDEPLAAPPWDEPGGPDAPAVDALDALAGFGDPAVEDAPPPAVDVEGFDVEEPPVSPEEMVGMPDAASLEDLTADGEPVPPSPFDVDLGESPAEPEDMVEVHAGPSWDEVVVACLDVARARGAMLVDPAGQVFASRGEWPDPGPDAIAKKLVSTLDRTLKDAPTRSISAPLMGKHLTAWRVPLADGLVTVAFIGDAAVRAEARPAIDAEIHRRPGA
jgi:hypothetical protein